MPGLHFIMALSIYQICYLHFLRNPCHVLTKPQPVALVLSPRHCLDELQVCQYTGMGDGVSVVGSCPEPLGTEWSGWNRPLLLLSTTKYHWVIASSAIYICGWYFFGVSFVFFGEICDVVWWKYSFIPYCYLFSFRHVVTTVAANQPWFFSQGSATGMPEKAGTNRFFTDSIRFDSAVKNSNVFFFRWFLTLKTHETRLNILTILEIMQS